MSDTSSPPDALLRAIRNLSHFHREHEKFYAQAPLAQALEIQAASRAIKALADGWRTAIPEERPVPNPFAGAEDLNPVGLTAERGILFMEGEGEPPEIQRLKRALDSLASDFDATGAWLASAMSQAWEIAGSLVPYPELADLLGERHRIIANDWQAADMSRLAARLLKRALDLLAPIDFAPAALRADLRGARLNPRYLYSASELLDRAADVIAESTTFVHENERRWRVFGDRVEMLLQKHA